LITASQAKTVGLIYRFSKPSAHFSYRLQIKGTVKKHGHWVTRWKLVKEVKKHGHFKGTKSMTVRKLFAGKPVNLGSYRLRLSADRGSKTLPFRVIKAKKMTQISAGSGFTCALRSNRTVWCWGENDSAELGNDEYSNTMIDYIPFPVEVPGISTATRIAAGADASHTCALLQDGKIECWGADGYGELGGGTPYDGGGGLPPIEVKVIQTATQIAAGTDHTCAVLSDGRLECWGHNNYGQLGDGVTDHGNGSEFGDFSPTAVEAKGISNATQVSAGYQFTCALLSDGTVRCWGLNNVGQLGDGVSDHGNRLYGNDFSPIPVEVTGISTATRVAVGFSHACALLSDGKIECWGLDNSGQLGDGPVPTYSTATPVEVKGISTATQIAAGGFSTCARLSSGKVECWGDNGFGQLGNGSIDEYGISTPVEVKGISTATQVTAGDFHTCALLSGGRVDCWGVNGFGQLGDGTTTSPLTPVEVTGISTAAQVAAGEFHTCALLSGGRVGCWGENISGQLGDGTHRSRRTPVEVTGI
jgi:alpha-tubulin suppressor-like RCC1 family protein